MIPLPTRMTEIERLASAASAHDVRVTGLCGVIGGEGVSTLAYALARRLAADGHRVLLVELHMARPAWGQRLALN